MTAPPPRSRTQQPNLCFALIDAHIQTGPDGYNPESQVPIKVFFWPEPGIRTNPERGGARALRQGAMLPRAFAVSNHQPTRFGLHDVMARSAAFACAGAGAARRWSCPKGPVACTNMFRRSLMNWSIGALPGENFDTWTESIRQKSARLCIARQPCFASLSQQLGTLFALRPVGPKGNNRPSQQPCSPSGGRVLGCRMAR